MSRIGVAGGFMGHVLLVVAEPKPLTKMSDVWYAFRKMARGERSLFSVDVVECSRGSEGLCEIKVVLSLDPSGQVLICGEYAGSEIFINVNAAADEIHIWQCPARFRKDNFHRDLMSKVLDDMRTHQQNWSWSTAVRAVFFSSEISSRIDKCATMKEIQGSWHAEPICTSIVVIFWQRYLQCLAGPECIDPLELILQVMPLRADRVLPGELFNAMLSRGWSMWQPRAKGKVARMVGGLEQNERARFISI